MAPRACGDEIYKYLILQWFCSGKRARTSAASTRNVALDRALSRQVLGSGREGGGRRWSAARGKAPTPEQTSGPPGVAAAAPIQLEGFRGWRQREAGPVERKRESGWHAAGHGGEWEPPWSVALGCWPQGRRVTDGARTVADVWVGWAHAGQKDSGAAGSWACG